MLDFTREDLENIFSLANEMRRYQKTRTDLLKDQVMASLFFEPSTRTRLGFETAMIRLGGSVIGFSEPGTTSIAKGETIADTIKMADAYANIIVVRHKYEGTARFASELADTPVINGGDGTQQHPTQAMIDLYTIWKEFGRIDGLHVAMVADLAHARLMASLCQALAYFDGVELSLISPSAVKLRPEIRDYLKSKRVKLYESENLRDVIRSVDVICMSRIMKERFEDQSEYERLKDRYVIDIKALEGAKDTMIVLHALPRVDELLPEVDATRHARYFQQAAYGIPVRMAILSLVLGARM